MTQSVEADPCCVSAAPRLNFNNHSFLPPCQSSVAAGLHPCADWCIIPALIRILFAEEDTLFRLMEVAMLRRLTAGGEKALKYFFGPDISAPVGALTGMADRLGLPELAASFCPQDGALDAVLPLADFLVVEREVITSAHLDAGSGRIRLIQKFGRDCSNIDLAAARRLGMPVASLERFSSISVVDHVMALLLALARNLIPAHQYVRARRDRRLEPQFEQAPPRTKFNWGGIGDVRVLAGQTLGLIGLGENSCEVARRAQAFRMRVLYYKRNPATTGEEDALGGVQYRPLKDLLAESDFVSVQVPYGPRTEKMVNEEFLAAMKPGACLINTSRGGIIDEQALYRALTGGHLARAALDVYRYEPVPADCPLLDLDNIIWTPHMAGGEPEFMLREVDDVLSNIARVLRGEPAAGLVV